MGTHPGEPLPVGVGVGAGWLREDISNLDQRVDDKNVRGDVTLPVGGNLALVGGVGYEDVKVSHRDAVIDTNTGLPVIGADGQYVTDKSTPRLIAYETSGLIWDAGVIWRPSKRTALEAHIGRRYGSTTYFGSFAYAPSARSSLNVAVYDSVTGFGGIGGGEASKLGGPFVNLPGNCTLKIRFAPGIASPLPSRFASVTGDVLIASTNLVLRRVRPQVEQWSIHYH